MKNNKVSTIIMIIAIIAVIAGIVFLGYGIYKSKTYKVQNPVATMEIENYGTIKIELYPDYAPETVTNFIKLANNGFYDGLTFHRTIPEFMIQGGDKNGDGTGSPSLKDLDENLADEEYTIKGEFIANKYNNKLKLERGVIAMARGDYSSMSPTLAEEGYNSAGSQFFIMTTDKNTSLSGYYAGFGKVIEGLDIVHNIENVECEAVASEGTESSESAEVSKPVTDVVISSITVETYGAKYEKPETMEPFNYMKWLYGLYGMQYEGE